MASASDRPALTPDTLRELAFDQSIRWTSQNDDLWQLIDNDLWALTRNPSLILSTVPEQKLEALLRRVDCHRLVDGIVKARQARLEQPTWFASQQYGERLARVAYFSMEYMLSEALPIYSGGLGNVAGDQLKAASDLGVPVTAVGMLWQHGYFRQSIGPDGRQQALYPVNDTRQMPIEPLHDAGGAPLRLAIQLPGLQIWLRGWQARVGLNRLLLLDTNDPANPPIARLIASELYGGDNEMRLRQELVLGIGGWRLLEAAGLQPDVLHLNDGHAAFAVLERARSHMARERVSFAVALNATRAGNLFTTHTPVEAGFDRFPPELVSQYLERYAEYELGISMQTLLAMGRKQPQDSHEPFNMAYLATRGAGAVNAVSQLHGHTSRYIFRELYSRWPLAAVPVGHVTNGIHLPTWVSPNAEAHWYELHGDEIPWRGDVEGVPTAWVQRMRRSMSALVERFSADRTVREYTEQYYLPMATAYRRRCAEGSALASELAHQVTCLRSYWHELAFTGVQWARENGQRQVDVRLHLGHLEPRQLAVQLYAEGRGEAPAEVHPLTLIEHDGAFASYQGHLPADRSAADYTARVVPGSQLGLSVPLELGLIHWQR